MRIVKFIFLPIFATVCFLSAFSQDKIYMGIGMQSGKVTDITAESIKFINSKGAGSQVAVKDVFLLFNSKGGYLVPYQMDFNNKATRNSINAFISPTAASGASDCVYTTDGRVITGAVLKETKKTITINENGNKYDIEAKRVGAIVYKDGHHSLLSPVITVADLLWSVIKEEEKKETQRTAEAAKAAGTKTTPVERDEVKTVGAPVTTVPAPARKIVKDEGTEKTGPIGENEVIEKKQLPVVSTADPVVQTQAAPPVKFEDIAANVSREEFERKALDKTRKLNEYLKVLCNKSADYAERNKAVDLAVTLFINEDAIVQTSSLNSDVRTNYKIRAYLKNIKLFNYDKVDIEWTKLQYVSNLKKAPDGNYYGTVSFEQVFRGYIDGKVVYEDLTVKNGEVVLKAYEKMINGVSQELWEVLLGDISVKQTKSL